MLLRKFHSQGNVASLCKAMGTHLSLWASLYINSLHFNSGEIFNIIFSHHKPWHHIATLSASFDLTSTNNWLLRANGYCSFFERWIADSSSWISQTPHSSILRSQNSNISTFTMWEWSFKDWVETVNLPFSDTVSDIITTDSIDEVPNKNGDSNSRDAIKDSGWQPSFEFLWSMSFLASKIWYNLTILTILILPPTLWTQYRKAVPHLKAERMSLQ